MFQRCQTDNKEGNGEELQGMEQVVPEKPDCQILRNRRQGRRIAGLYV